ncbi:MAG: hypothetical protein JWO09_135 [Bacteroidetes bacterium]|nr:hypothetical protein [Bacteroidota bacterium]
MIDKNINNISLDTTFFEEQNFLSGAKLQEIGKLSKEGVIKAYITDIVFREVLSRFEKGLKTTDEKIKKPKSMLEGNARLLKNFSQYKSYFDLPSVDVTVLYKEFANQFETWIKKSKFIIIKTDHITIASVMQNYFSNKPPFKEGEKKHEFPDAFTLQALSEYFSKLNERSYVLSRDKDLLTFKSDALIPISDSTEIIDAIIRAQKEKETRSTIQFIEKVFDKERDKLGDEIALELEESISDELTYNDFYNDANNLTFDYVEFVDISNVTIHPFSIIYLNNTDAKLEADVTFQLNAKFYMIDDSHAWFDKESNMWYGRDSVEKIINESITTSVTFNIDHNPKAGKDYASVEFDEINNGKEFNIWSYVR